MTYFIKTRGIHFWSRILNVTARRTGAERATHAAPHVPTFGLLVPQNRER